MYSAQCGVIILAINILISKIRCFSNNGSASVLKKLKLCDTPVLPGRKPSPGVLLVQVAEEHIGRIQAEWFSYKPANLPLSTFTDKKNAEKFLASSALFQSANDTENQRIAH